MGRESERVPSHLRLHPKGLLAMFLHSVSRLITSPDSFKTSPGKREIAFAFAVFWLIWAIGRWPQWTGGIWLADDFNVWEFSFWNLTLGGARQGRWLNGAWYSLYHLAPPPDHTFAWLLRLIQGALHAGASTIMLVLLVRPLGWVGAAFSVLLFHSWAFHSEAVIWMAGSTYPLAALLSLGGVALIVSGRGQRWPVALSGAVLIAASVHSNQAPALIGGCFWVLWLVFRSLAPDQAIQWKPLIRQAVWIGGGYFVGALISVVTMKLLAGDRLSETILLSEKWQQWGVMLHRLWWFPEVYPRSLQWAHALLIGLSLATWLTASLRRRITLWQSLSLVGLALFLSIAPFLANLAAPESYIPVRVFYGGTLIWVGLAGWLFSLGRQLPLLNWVALGLLGSILGWNWLLGAREAREYVELHAMDLNSLRELEAFAAEHGTNEVLVMDWYHSAPWVDNLLGLRLYYAPSVKYPILANEFSAYRFVHYYSDSLVFTSYAPDEPGQPMRWQVLREKYAEMARNLPSDRPLYFVHLPEENIVLVVPR